VGQRERDLEEKAKRLGSRITYLKRTAVRYRLKLENHMHYTYQTMRLVCFGHKLNSSGPTPTADTFLRRFNLFLNLAPRSMPDKNTTYFRRRIKYLPIGLSHVTESYKSLRDLSAFVREDKVIR
jgi:hypothetical protein